MACNNANSYTLGKIRKYNIVIAVLPNGEYGIASAVSVAKDMLYSFLNIRLGLIVGISGSALSKKYNIRLSDIIVSNPYNRNGGIF